MCRLRHLFKAVQQQAYCRLIRQAHFQVDALEWHPLSRLSHRSCTPIEVLDNNNKTTIPIPRHCFRPPRLLPLTIVEWILEWQIVMGTGAPIPSG